MHLKKESNNPTEVLTNQAPNPYCKYMKENILLKSTLPETSREGKKFINILYVL